MVIVESVLSCVLDPFFVIAILLSMTLVHDC